MLLQSYHEATISPYCIIHSKKLRLNGDGKADDGIKGLNHAMALGLLEKWEKLTVTSPKKEN